jgi:TetR/AcrR family transcriptional regulator
MVSLLHKGENKEKGYEIISVAQKRFALFGFDKTTMQEIANDLNMSKGSLYYYFPNKENLYKSIIIKEQKIFIDSLNDKLNNTDSLDRILIEYVKTRLDLFRKLINLSRSRLEDFTGMHSIIKETLINLQMQEKDIVKEIFRKGNKKKFCSISNIDETSDLFLDLLRGLRLTLINKMSIYYIEENEYEHLVKKSVLFVELFLKGIEVKK